MRPRQELNNQKVDHTGESAKRETAGGEEQLFPDIRFLYKDKDEKKSDIDTDGDLIGSEGERQSKKRNGDVAHSLAAPSKDKAAISENRPNGTGDADGIHQHAFTKYVPFRQKGVMEQEQHRGVRADKRENVLAFNRPEYAAGQMCGESRGCQHE